MPLRPPGPPSPGPRLARQGRGRGGEGQRLPLGRERSLLGVPAGRHRPLVAHDNDNDDDDRLV
jgi:hypothetical protein